MQSYEHFPNPQLFFANIFCNGRRIESMYSPLMVVILVVIRQCPIPSLAVDFSFFNPCAVLFCPFCVVAGTVFRSFLPRCRAVLSCTFTLQFLGSYSIQTEKQQNNNGRCGVQGSARQRRSGCRGFCVPLFSKQRGDVGGFMCCIRCRARRRPGAAPPGGRGAGDRGCACRETGGCC